MNYTTNQIKSALKKNNYAFFSNGDYNINIIGVRNLTNGVEQKDNFNDELHLIYCIKGKEVHSVYPITTDPGLWYLKNPMSRLGTAILVPGQYKSAYCLGYHQNKYEALVQKNPVKVYRDNNRDQSMDFVSIHQGIYGINIHKAGLDSVQVHNWSAGCQVFKRRVDFNQFLSICKKSAALYGNKFTYTLLTTEDLK